MKTCTKCLKSQPLSRFNYKSREKGTLQAHCKSCSRASVRDHYARNAAYYIGKARARNLSVKRETQDRIIAFLSTHACVDCGESDPVVLDFDHMDECNKLASVADMLRDCCAWARIEAEINKCIVRCANCHRRRTAAQFGWYKLQTRG